MAECAAASGGWAVVSRARASQGARGRGAPVRLAGFLPIGVKKTQLRDLNSRSDL